MLAQLSATLYGALNAHFDCVIPPPPAPRMTCIHTASMSRRLRLCAVLLAVLSVACSDAMGPSQDPFTACDGRPAELHLLLIVENRDANSALDFHDTLAISNLRVAVETVSGTVEPPPGVPRVCQGGEVAARLRWPGSQADSTYDGRWVKRFGGDIAVVFTINDEHLRILFPSAGVLGTWEFLAPDEEGARGRTVRGP